MRLHLRAPLPPFLLVLFFLTANAAYAATPGTIISPHQYAWNDNGGYVNWNADGGDVTVTDTALTGYIWSAGFGWINLSPTDGGVTNSGGTLSGFAWGENTGWMDFTGVTIDSNGVFHGETVAQSTFGTLNFDCAYCDVTTSWLGSLIRVATPVAPAPIGNSNGMPVVSSSLPYDYQSGSIASSSQTTVSVVPALKPKNPPPHIQPKTRPKKTAAHSPLQSSQHQAPQSSGSPFASPSVADTSGTSIATTTSPASSTSTTIAYPSTSASAPQPEIPAHPTTTIQPTPTTPACSLFTCWIQAFFGFFRSIF